MKRTETTNLDSLYIAWNEDRAEAAPKPLKVWLTEHPAQKTELLQWAADAPLADCADRAAYDAAGEARALKIGREVVAEFRAKYEAAQSVQSVPLISLTEAAKAKNLTPKALAAQIGIGVTTFAKLQNRMFVAASVPQELVRRLAETLETTADAVRAYLQQPTTLAAGAMYRADGVPQVAAQENFADAVASCFDMTPKQKAYWLNAD